MGKLIGLDLFSGIGGISLALSPWVKPIAYCENDRYAQAVLLSRMRDGILTVAPVWNDITTLVPGLLPRYGIEIVYGGFPCQDISIAGIGKGLEGERSGLFFEVARLLKEIRPAFVFLENVPAIRTRGAERVGQELAALGYDCRWNVLSARALGAPHLRERWFLLAHAHGTGLPLAQRDEIPANLDHGNEPEFLVQKNFWGESARDRARVDDGLSPRVHRIKCSGNAVVPQQAREAFRRLAGFY